MHPGWGFVTFGTRDGLISATDTKIRHALEGSNVSPLFTLKSLAPGARQINNVVSVYLQLFVDVAKHSEK